MRYFLPVFSICRPFAIAGVEEVRRRYPFSPNPLPTWPARPRPYPRVDVADLSACPGIAHTGPLAFQPPAFRFTTSPVVRPRRQAVAGLSATALSQVIVVSGLGNSCSQALFAHRPSPIVGSGRKTISIACGLIAGGFGNLP